MGVSGISQNYIVNALWQQNVQSKIIDQQFEKLGISIGKEQIIALIAQIPSYANNPQFQDEKGAFDPNKFGAFIAELKQLNPSTYQQWLKEEKSYVDAAKRETYLSLIRAGLGVTFCEGEAAYHQEADRVNLRYVGLPYTSITDSSVKISDQEIQDYVRKHPKEFKQEEMRNIQFILAPEVASTADKKTLEESLQIGRAHV